MRNMIKLCKCRGVTHRTYHDLDLVAGHRCCYHCGMRWGDMRTAQPNAFQRFERGDLVITWRGDAVSIVDVGRPLIARTEPA